MLQDQYLKENLITKKFIGKIIDWFNLFDEQYSDRNPNFERYQSSAQKKEMNLIGQQPDKTTEIDQEHSNLELSHTPKSSTSSNLSPKSNSTQTDSEQEAWKIKEYLKKSYSKENKYDLSETNSLKEPFPELNMEEEPIAPYDEGRIKRYKNYILNGISQVSNLSNTKGQVYDVQKKYSPNDKNAIKNNTQSKICKDKDVNKCEYKPLLEKNIQKKQRTNELKIKNKRIREITKDNIENKNEDNHKQSFGSLVSLEKINEMSQEGSSNESFRKDSLINSPSGKINFVFEYYDMEVDKETTFSKSLKEIRKTQNNQKIQRSFSADYINKSIKKGKIIIDCSAQRRKLSEDNIQINASDDRNKSEEISSSKKLQDYISTFVYKPFQKNE